MSLFIELHTAALIGRMTVGEGVDPNPVNEHLLGKRGRAVRRTWKIPTDGDIEQKMELLVKGRATVAWSAIAIPVRAGLGVVWDTVNIPHDGVGPPLNSKRMEAH